MFGAHEPVNKPGPDFAAVPIPVASDSSESTKSNLTNLPEVASRLGSLETAAGGWTRAQRAKSDHGLPAGSCPRLRGRPGSEEGRWPDPMAAEPGGHRGSLAAAPDPGESRPTRCRRGSAIAVAGRPRGGVTRLAWEDSAPKAKASPKGRGNFQSNPISGRRQGAWGGRRVAWGGSGEWRENSGQWSTGDLRSAERRGLETLAERRRRGAKTAQRLLLDTARPSSTGESGS